MLDSDTSRALALALALAPSIHTHTLVEAAAVVAVLLAAPVDAQAVGDNVLVIAPPTVLGVVADCSVGSEWLPDFVVVVVAGLVCSGSGGL